MSNKVPVVIVLVENVVQVLDNHIAEHHLKTNHRIDWDSAECVTYSRDYYE